MTTRQSPLRMGLDPDQVLRRNGWDIVLTYLGEKIHTAPFLADLSHVAKWALQGRDLERVRPAGLTVPDKVGQVSLAECLVVVRLTARECRILVLGDKSPSFEDPSFIDMTDAYAAVALVGPQCLEILSRVAAVDLNAPRQRVPCAAQAPLEEVTCLFVRLDGRGGVPGLIISVDRGYGQFLLEALLDAGKEYGVAVAGWSRFSGWFPS